MEEKKKQLSLCLVSPEKDDVNLIGVVNEKKKRHANDKKSKKRRKTRNRPYSSKNFLLRPKINAPANTTQFLCEDKEYYLSDQERNLDSVGGSSNNSESDSITSSSSSTSTQLSLTPSELYNDRLPSDSVFWDVSDKRFIEEFERMYDDVRIELLCSHSVDELTTRCVELESAVHNLQYLLQKEIDRRQKMEELLYLIKANSRLKEENERLQHEQASTNEEQNAV